MGVTGSTVVIGADIGQRRDPTAIVVCEYERVEVSPAGVPQDPTGLRDLLNIATGVEEAPLYATRYVVRALERPPLGTPYPAVARRVNGICRAMQVRGYDVFLAVDATGVGRPVIDMIESELDDAVHLTAVTISGGDKCPPSPLLRRDIVMGKVWMVSRLQALLQSRRIVLPRSAEALGLADELEVFEIRVSADSGHDEMGAFKTGKHDDLVTALGLSVLGEAHTQVTYGPDLWR